jgi:hypothetical protein
MADSFLLATSIDSLPGGTYVKKLGAKRKPPRISPRPRPRRPGSNPCVTIAAGIR